MMMPYIPARWYYKDADKNLQGPVSTVALDVFFMEGFISLSTRIIRENGTDFQPYSSIFTTSSPRTLFF
jgi:hypothetical protein